MRRTSDGSFSFLVFIEVYLIYNVVFVPGLQQSDSYTYAFIYIYVCVCVYIYDPWVRKIPWRRKGQPTLVFLLRESHGQRSLVGYSP